MGLFRRLRTTSGRGNRSDPAEACASTREAPLLSWPLAVLDLETTGTWAEGTDRIVEIGIVQLDQNLQITSEYETLVHPGRDLGPSWIHRITGREVMDAPPFGAVADDIVEALAGRVIVAFVASFDIRFLVAEFRRLGLDLPNLARFDPHDLCGSTLAAACDARGIRVESAHTALGDARATALLLQALRDAGDLNDVHVERPADAVSWPQLDYEPTEWRREDSAHRAATPAAMPVLVQGDALCFTGDGGLTLGDLLLTRAVAEQIALSVGFVVKPNVSKKVRLVVAADPDSPSGKARRARELDIPIVHEHVFWRSLGYEVQTSAMTAERR